MRAFLSMQRKVIGQTIQIIAQMGTVSLSMCTGNRPSVASTVGVHMNHANVRCTSETAISVEKNHYAKCCDNFRETVKAPTYVVEDSN